MFRRLLFSVAHGVYLEVFTKYNDENGTTRVITRYKQNAQGDSHKLQI